MSAPMVAALNATLTSKFDETHKSLGWLRFVYPKDEKGKECSPEQDLRMATNLKLDKARKTTNSAPAMHSTPVHRVWNVPPVFETPGSVRSNLSVFVEEAEESKTEVVNAIDNNGGSDDDGVNGDNHVVDFSDNNSDDGTPGVICVTCEGNCYCTENPS